MFIHFRWPWRPDSRRTATGPHSNAPFRREINDSEAAALLARWALLEIRDLAWRCRSGQERPDAEVFDRIHFLANAAHNLPGIAREGGRDRQAMYWVWSTAGPDGRTWMLDAIDYADSSWTPPAPPQPPSRDPATLSAWRKTIARTGWWPVRSAIGRSPLPASARVLKAVNTQEAVALHEEAHERRFGLGVDATWLRAHVDPRGTHYLVPDPASYFWPDSDRPWWQCRVLLRMLDGRQVKTSVAVHPDSFRALPDTLPGYQQRCLVYLMRATRYDIGLWGQDHKAQCDPDRCGYRFPEPRP